MDFVRSYEDSVILKVDESADGRIKRARYRIPRLVRAAVKAENVGEAYTVLSRALAEAQDEMRAEWQVASEYRDVAFMVRYGATGPENRIRAAIKTWLKANYGKDGGGEPIAEDVDDV